MDSESSVTKWISELKQGDDDAAQLIWERYFRRLRGLAKKKLGPAARRHRDEEDVALSAINALCVGAQDGRFRQLENRDDIWQLLVMLTSRKAANVWRAEKRTKEVGESVLSNRRPEHDQGMANILEASPSEGFIDHLTQTCEELLSVLDPKLREVALRKMEGYTNQEIAEERNRSVKSVERYLKMIRERWTAAGYV